MRVRSIAKNISVHAIAGTYVVLLGIDMKKTATKGLLGFSIHRADLTENEQYWLLGFKTFKSTAPDIKPGTFVSTSEHPIQSFFWADYTAKPNHRYTYKIVPKYGVPKNLTEKNSITVTVSTEDETKGAHAIYFNSGVAGSQAYIRKFGNKKPQEVSERKAFIWLSRGLEEALLIFIRKAKNSHYSLRASVYEFNYLPVLEEFRKAAQRGVDVKIIYDSRKNSPKKASDAAIEKVGIRKLMERRTRGKSYISHNKFIVLLKDSIPQEVWTGSTNITAGGIFGQANVGHIVRDAGVAQKYHEYWQQLYEDPTNKSIKKWNEANSPDPSGKPKTDTIIPLFSPRDSLNVLDWYAERLDKAEKSIHLTAAFGVNPKFEAILVKDKDYLRYILLEKRGNNYEIISRDKDVCIAAGAKLGKDYLSRWMKEVLTGFNVWVAFVHTKFMLLDPLSENPTVITGSANFSKNSILCNDENMLVIQGNKRVADIYLGEFMRLFSHFYFRDFVTRGTGKKPTTQKKSVKIDSRYLTEDDSWCKGYYVPEWKRTKQRLLFR